jgi:hypothetical protein
MTDRHLRVGAPGSGKRELLVFCETQVSFRERRHVASYLLLKGGEVVLRVHCEAKLAVPTLEA